MAAPASRGSSPRAPARTTTSSSTCGPAPPTTRSSRPRSRGLREPPVTAGGSNIVVGFGADALARGCAPTTRPPSCAPFEAIEGDGHRAPATQHDLWVWTHGTGEDVELDVARAVAAVLGAGRDARGRAAVLRLPRQPRPHRLHRRHREPAGRGGARGRARSPTASRGRAARTCITQKWVHDLERVPRPDARASRRAPSGAPSPTASSSTTSPPTAHIARVVIEEDGEELEIYRRSTPYGRVGELGLYFLGLQRRPQPLRQDARTACSG